MGKQATPKNYQPRARRPTEAETPADAVHMITIPDARRTELLAALATMPAEAFAYFVLACGPAAMLDGAHTQIWPDGIGGFTGTSRAAITAVRAAAETYLDTAR